MRSAILNQWTALSNKSETCKHQMFALCYKFWNVQRKTTNIINNIQCNPCHVILGSKNSQLQLHSVGLLSDSNLARLITLTLLKLQIEQLRGSDQLHNMVTLNLTCSENLTCSVSCLCGDISRVKVCVYICLHESETFDIPAGWIALTSIQPLSGSL